VELVKNKASGKYFVLIDDTGGTDFLVITPDGKVRRLERNLFAPPGFGRSPRSPIQSPPDKNTGRYLFGVFR